MTPDDIQAVYDAAAGQDLDAKLHPRNLAGVKLLAATLDDPVPDGVQKYKDQDSSVVWIDDVSIPEDEVQLFERGTSNAVSTVNL